MTGIEPYVYRDGTVLGGPPEPPDPWAGDPETPGPGDGSSARRGRGTTATGRRFALRARRASVDRNWASLSPEAKARLLALDERESRGLR